MGIASSLVPREPLSAGWQVCLRRPVLEATPWPSAHLLASSGCPVPCLVRGQRPRLTPTTAPLEDRAAFSLTLLPQECDS